MWNSNVEMFLSQYFLFKSVLGQYLTERKKLFYALSEICMISATEVDELYNLAENEIVEGITGESEYKRHQRIQKYCKLVGITSSNNPEEEELIRIKGNAFIVAKSYNMISEPGASGNMVYSCLLSAVASGTILAMQMMGILQCEGIFLEKDIESGISYLSKAADWNDNIGTLALLYYSEENRSYNMNRLHYATRSTPFSKLYNIATQKYGISCDEEIEEVILLNKAFDAGVIRRTVYDSNYARIIYSKALCGKDKERVIFSQNKELLSIVSDLPINMTLNNNTTTEFSSVQQLPLKRENEVDSVIRSLKNSDFRASSFYRPLCLCCESKYILNLYANALAENNKSIHIEKIDVGALSEYDFEPTYNNIFIRSVEENKDNRFLMFFYGEISERKMDSVKKILQGTMRTKFHLINPGITLNMEAVLPICFCEKQNVDLLKPYCDVVMLSTVNNNEFSSAIEDIFVNKEKLYGVRSIKLNEKIDYIFKGYDIDTAENLIDAAVRGRRKSGADITLSRDILREYIQENSKPVIGFGGTANGRN